MAQMRDGDRPQAKSGDGSPASFDVEELEDEEESTSSGEDGDDVAAGKKPRRTSKKKKRRKRRRGGRPPLARDPLEVFGTDIMMAILNYLDARSVALSLLVSRAWRRVASSDRLWSPKLKIWNWDKGVPNEWLSEKEMRRKGGMF